MGRFTIEWLWLKDVDSYVFTCNVIITVYYILYLSVHLKLVSLKDQALSPETYVVNQPSGIGMGRFWCQSLIP